MELLGIEFQIDPALGEERVFQGENPGETAVRLATQKASEVSSRRPEDVVVGADTLVVLDHLVLGKPATAKQAREMLEALSGRTHVVVTGVTVAQASTGRVEQGFERTLVEFDVLRPGVIEAYVATGEPMDKAGAYAIQGRGSVLVKGISGCYFNVVGLPLRRLSQMLAQFGVRVLG
jgi:septum formation protein